MEYKNNVYASIQKTKQKLKYCLKFVCKSYEGGLKLNVVYTFSRVTS